MFDFVKNSMKSIVKNFLKLKKLNFENAVNKKINLKKFRFDIEFKFVVNLLYLK